MFIEQGWVGEGGERQEAHVNLTVGIIAINAIVAIVAINAMLAILLWWTFSLWPASCMHALLNFFLNLT